MSYLLEALVGLVLAVRLVRLALWTAELLFGTTDEYNDEGR